MGNQCTATFRAIFGNGKRYNLPRLLGHDISSSLNVLIQITWISPFHECLAAFRCQYTNWCELSQRPNSQYHHCIIRFNC